MTLARAAAAEFGGTALLLAVVVGSGIMGERLAAGNAAVALLANSLATAGGLYVLIVTMGPVSGAHFNPVVSAVAAFEGATPWKHVAVYVPLQFAGAFAGVWLAHAMFALPLLQVSVRERAGVGQWIAEFIATFGLVAAIRICARQGTAGVAAVVAAWIGAAYWFTASTSFANPAVTLARAFTDTFAGIAPAHVGAFIVVQGLGAACGLLAARLLAPGPKGA